jgi:hypothetical protein
MQSNSLRENAATVEQALPSEILTKEQIQYAPATLPPDSLEKYQLARSYVEHENTLVAHRTTWYITFQGFLFAALFFAVRLFDKNGFPACSPESPFVAFGIILICALGLLSSFLLFALQGVAYDQIKHVQAWWEATGVAKYYPVITGRIRLSRGRFLLRADKLIGLIVLVWVLFVVALVSAGLRLTC